MPTLLTQIEATTLRQLATKMSSDTSGLTGDALEIAKGILGGPYDQLHKSTVEAYLGWAKIVKDVCKKRKRKA